MRPWLPSYANIHLCSSQKSQFQSVICFLTRCVTPDFSEETLIEIMAGRMISSESEMAATSADELIQGCRVTNNLNQSAANSRGYDEYRPQQNSNYDLEVSCNQHMIDAEDCGNILQTKGSENSCTTKNLPIRLKADARIGLLALVCTDDGKLKLRWWRGHVNSSERHPMYTNLFVPSQNTPIGNVPDLEISMAPDQCTFLAAAGSNDRVLSVECQNLGMCKSEPRCKRCVVPEVDMHH